jgi:hypothetical protein
MMNAGYHWEWLSAFTLRSSQLLVCQSNSTDNLFQRPNSLDFNKVNGRPPSGVVISHKNSDSAILEYALPEACKAGFST